MTSVTVHYKEVAKAINLIADTHNLPSNIAHEFLRKYLGINHLRFDYPYSPRTHYLISEKNAHTIRALAGPNGKTMLRVLEINHGS